MQVEIASPDEVKSVALAMRESDFKEFSALFGGDGREALAEFLAKRFAGMPEVLVARCDNEPIAIGGVIESRPNVVTLLFFATDHMPLVGFGLTRFIKHTLFPRLRGAGVHRIECVSISDYTAAHRWIEALGLKREGGPLLGYGKNKETFFQFSWVSDACSASA